MKILTVISALLYLAVLSYGLDIFPPYFFCDEAIHGVDAYWILKQGTDFAGVPLPIYFRGLGEYALSGSVYVQVPFIFLFGLTENAVRFRSVAMSFIGVFAVYLTLKHTYKVRGAFLVFVLFSAVPSWFVNSRSGFEYITGCSFYLCFLASYLHGLSRGRLWFSLAGLFGALSFYSYNPSRGWVAVSLALLVVFNLRSHLKLFKSSILGSLTFVIVMLPFAYYYVTSPDEAMSRLYNLGFQKFLNLPIDRKLEHIFSNYLMALNPSTWLSWEGSSKDTSLRHLVPPLSLIPIWVLPFAMGGFVLSIFRISKTEDRSLIAALIAAPSAASLILFNHERTLLLVPLFLLFAMRGYGLIEDLIESRLKTYLSYYVFPVLFYFSVTLLNHSLTKSKYFYDDWGFFGVQGGATELFSYLKANKQNLKKVYLSHGTFNAAWVFPKFYFPLDPEYVELGSPENLCEESGQKLSGSIWAINIDSVAHITRFGCPLEKEVIKLILSPSGTPIFEVVRLTHGKGFDDWFRKYEIDKNLPQVDKVNLNGVEIVVNHPPLASGDALSIVDGNSDTWIRVDEINPATFTISFLKPFPAKKVRISITNMTKVTTKVFVKNVTNTYDFGVWEFNKDRNDSEEHVFEVPNEVGDLKSVDVIFEMPDHGPKGSPHLKDIVVE